MDEINLILFFLFFIVKHIYAAEINDLSKCIEYPCLIFNDDFNTLDHSVWEHMISRYATGNQEFQYYTNNRTNSFIRKGTLHLKPTLTNETFDDAFLTSGTLDLWGTSKATYCTSNRYNEGCFGKGTPENILNPIQSAGVKTEKSFSFKYGKIEVKARMPRGDWLWPAIWLMPKYNAYGDWPASGEIDLLEARGNDELYSGDDKERDHVGNKMISQSLHWGPYYPEDGHAKTLVHVVKKTGSYSDGFHTYSMEWDPEIIRFSIDNHTTINITVDEKGFWELGKFGDISSTLKNPWEGGTKMAPFDEEFYIIMNLAVGGTNNYFHDNFHPKPPWTNNGGEGKKAMKDFWDAREKWLPTWKGDETALKIDYVKVWATKPT